MSAIITLIVELDRALQDSTEKYHNSSKVFSILTSMCHVCRCIPLVRKYLRHQVLPPLKEVIKRPEELKCLKGRLVKLMTDIDTNTKVCVV